jgi:predicted outer membrane repeat protein
METILLLNDESGSPEPRLQNVAGSKVTQLPSEGMPGCNCDRWGDPSPDCVEDNDSGALRFIQNGSERNGGLLSSLGFSSRSDPQSEKLI